MKSFLLVATVLVASPVAAVYADGVTVQLRGSRASVRRQHEVAQGLELTFLRTPAQVREFVRTDRLEHVSGNENYTMAKVAYPYARPAVKLFIERLAEQYRAFSGEKLVVTSLTRPKSRQPRNASPLSVHPTGIAVDLRIPKGARNRKWLEETLLSLERSGVLDATREKRPPHYHVAVFPERYEAYVERMDPRADDAVVVESEPEPEVAANLAPVDATSLHEAALPVVPVGVAVLSLGVVGGGVGATAIRRKRRRRQPASANDSSDELSNPR